MVNITLAGASEALFVICIFIFGAGFLFADLNPTYGRNINANNVYQLAANKTISDLATYQQTAQSQIQSGEVSLISYAGLVLKTSWSLFQTLISIIWNSISFGFVETAMQDIGVQSPLPLIVRAILTIALVFVVGKLFFRVKT